MNNIQKLWFFWIIYHHLVSINQALNTIFISNIPNPNCLLQNSANSCNGTLINPYDNLLFMLNMTEFEDNTSYDIMFLGTPNTIHYVTLYQQNYYNYTLTPNNYLLNFTNITLNLQPTYCADYPNSGGQCIPVASTSTNIIIYLKTINFTISVSNILTIQNIIFDGSDLLYSGTDNCLGLLSACCSSSSTTQNTNCIPNLNQIIINTTTTLRGIFNITQASIYNTIFQNIYSINSSSLIVLNPGGYLIISGTTFQNIYFPNGIISNNNPIQQSTTIITITYSNVLNYNPLGFSTLTTSTGPIEGYFINLAYQFQGVITITSNSFNKMSNSFIQTQCVTNTAMFPSSQSKQPYLQTVNLQQFINFQGYSTGAIAISSLNGDLIILNNTFNSIAGFSGTGIVVMNLINTSSVYIYNNIFSNNFALVNAASIKIYQIPGGSNFANSVSCQPITLSNNIFVNNSGCPGASANVVIYCDTGLSSGTQLLDPASTSTNQLTIFAQKFQLNQTILQINNNTFINNTLVYSNSLLIYGFTGVTIQFNSFYNNTVQTSQMPAASFAYLNLGQSAINVWNNAPNVFSWQLTTVLLISLCSNVNVNNNIFNNNSGVNSMTTLMGSQITLDNSILIGTSTQFLGNSFFNNTGMPSNIDITAYTYTSVPLITVNFADISNYLSSLQNPSMSMIIFGLNNFTNNTFNYLIPYTYQNTFSSDINDYVSFIRIYDENDRNSGNPTWTQISTDTQVQITIQNSVFLINQIITTLSTGGSFFLNNIVTNLLIQNCLFYSNVIVWLQMNAITNPTGLSSTQNCYTSTVCWNLPTGDQSSTYIFPYQPSLIGVWNKMTNTQLVSNLTVANCNFSSNVGQLFNVTTQPGIPITYIASSNLFFNHTSYSGTGAIFNWNISSIKITMTNNLFNWTNNADVIMLFTTYPLSFTENSNIYANNNLSLGLKYFNYSQSTINTSPMPQITHSSINTQYTNNTIPLSTLIPSLDPTSALVTFISNNINLIYTEQNSIIQTVQSLNFTYLIINQTTFIANNISYTQSTSLPLVFISLINASMTMTNCNLQGYSIIDLSLLYRSTLVSAYAILSLNSTLQLTNNTFGLFTGIISGVLSTITISNLTTSASFTISIKSSLFIGLSYLPIFSMTSSKITVYNSAFKFNNIYLQATSSNIVISGCKLTDSKGDSLTTWGNTVFQCQASNLSIINSNLSNILMTFTSTSSSLILQNSIIWGYLTNPAFSIGLFTSSILNAVNTIFNQTFGNIITDISSNMNFQNTNHISGGITSTFTQSSYVFNAANFSNCSISLTVTNGNLTIMNSIFNEYANPGGISLVILNGIINFSNTIFSDNSGILTLTQSSGLFNNATFSGTGPSLNSGGITFNILNSSLTTIGSTMLNNYAMITLENCTNIQLQLNFKETLTYNDPTLTSILSFYIIKQSTLTIQNSNIMASYEFITSYLSDVTLLNTNFSQNSIQYLANDVLRFKLSTVNIINCNFTSYSISNNLLSFINSTNVISQVVNFYNNVVANSSLMIISPAIGVNLDQLNFINNSFSNSRDLTITLAENDPIQISNSMFLDKFDMQSYHLYFKSHNGQTSLINCSFSGFLQGLFISTLTDLIITNMTMTSDDSIQFTNTSTPRFLIYIESSQLITIKNSLFQGLTTYLGAINRKSFEGEILIINNCTFKNNKALQGATLFNTFFSNNSIVVIENSNFINNSANLITNLQGISADNPGYGGSIFSYCASNIFCNLTIRSTTFQNNNADSIAGAIYSNYFPPFIDLETVQFIDNEAPYGPDMATDPVQFIVMDPGTTINKKGNYNWQSVYFGSNRILSSQLIQSTNVLKELVSGSLASSLLVIYTLDIYQQVAGGDDSTEITLSFSNLRISKATYDNEMPDVQPVTNITLMRVQNGVFKCDNVLLSFWPGSNVTATLKVNGLNDLPPYIKSRIDSVILAQMHEQIHLDLDFRNCIMGEVFLDSGVCMPCGVGFFSLIIPNNSKSPCSSCDFDVSYCLGAAKVAPRPGYWRKNATADLVLKCPNSAACLGNVNLSNYTLTGVCAQYHSGNLCDRCPQGSINDGDICIECLNNAWYYIRFVLAISMQTVLIFLSVKSTLESLAPLVDEEAKQKANNNLLGSVATKILTNFFQIVTIISTFNFQWPNILNQLLQSNEAIVGNSNHYFSFDCFLLFSGSNEDNLTYIKYLVIFLMPLIFSGIATLIWILIYLKKKRPIKGNKEFKKDLLTTLVILCFNLQPNLIRYALMIFQCENLYRDDIPEYYFTSNYQIQCYTLDYNWKSLTLGGINFGIWGIAFPVCIFVYLGKHKKELDTEKIKSKFSFLYSGYRNKRYYWEEIILLKKVLMIANLVFVKLLSIKLQAWLLFITLFIALILQIKYSPIKNKTLNLIEEKAHFSLTIFGFAALYFAGDQQIIYFDYVVLVMCAVTNAWFIFDWIIFYVKLQWEANKNNAVLQKIAKILRFKKKENITSEESRPTETKEKINNDSSLHAQENYIEMNAIQDKSIVEEEISSDQPTNKPLMKEEIILPNDITCNLHPSKLEDTILNLKENGEIELADNTILSKSGDSCTPQGEADCLAPEINRATDDGKCPHQEDNTCISPSHNKSEQISKKENCIDSPKLDENNAEINTNDIEIHTELFNAKIHEKYQHETGLAQNSEEKPYKIKEKIENESNENVTDNTHEQDNDRIPH